MASDMGQAIGKEQSPPDWQLHYPYQNSSIKTHKDYLPASQHNIVVSTMWSENNPNAESTLEKKNALTNLGKYGWYGRT